MSNYFIDYGKLIDDAMHIIVKQALGYIKNGSLPGKHHFFISFLTSHPGVNISKSLKDKYPDEMTIVLQHQFENLKITDEKFSVVLSFDNVKEKIEIPFDSLIAFADPSVKFGLQFSHIGEKPATDTSDSAENNIPAQATKVVMQEDNKKSKKPGGKDRKTKDTTSAKSNVVKMETFRKK